MNATESGTMSRRMKCIEALVTVSDSIMKVEQKDAWLYVL